MGDDYVERLALALHDAMERLDHATGKTWEELSDHDREFCRHCIKAVIREQARKAIGGTVAQATSKATGVTLDKIHGQITMNNAPLAAGTAVSFVLTNPAITVGDMLVVTHMRAGTLGAYIINSNCADGGATIDVINTSDWPLSEAIVIRFHVIKGFAVDSSDESTSKGEE